MYPMGHQNNNNTHSSYEPRGSAGKSVSQTPKCNTPSAFLPHPDLDDPHQPVAEFSPPPEPSRQPLDPSTALVPLGYAFHDDGGSVLAPSVVDGVSQQRVSLQVLPLAASQTGYTSSAPSSLPPLRLCDQSFPDSPALLALSPWSAILRVRYQHPLTILDLPFHRPPPLAHSFMLGLLIHLFKKVAVTVIFSLMEMTLRLFLLSLHRRFSRLF